MKLEQEFSSFPFDQKQIVIISGNVLTQVIKAGKRNIYFYQSTFLYPMKRIEEEIFQSRPFNSQYHKAAVNLIFTGKWIIKRHSEIFQEYNLSLQQYNLLRILRGAMPVPVTLNYIRQRMLDKMSDASRIVENLFNKGLVDRKLNPKDRRKVNIQITEEGLHILSEIDKKSHILDSYLHNLDGKEIDQLNALLDKLRD